MMTNDYFYIPAGTQISRYEDASGRRRIFKTVVGVVYSPDRVMNAGRLFKTLNNFIEFKTEDPKYPSFRVNDQFVESGTKAEMLARLEGDKLSSSPNTVAVKDSIIQFGDSTITYEEQIEVLKRQLEEAKREQSKNSEMRKTISPAEYMGKDRTPKLHQDPYYGLES